METIGQSRLRTFLSSGWTEDNVSNTEIRKDRGYEVQSFPSLVRNVAHLTFYNRDQVLLFRGQAEDHRNRQKNTTIQPSLFRGRQNQTVEEWHRVLARRYAILAEAEEMLVEMWESENLPDFQRLERHRNLRWTILQHYEVCATPLLDVTQSLRVAATFALAAAKKDEAFIYVLGVPQISGAITASAEAELQILRLASMCPPTATRPHFQEGYLLGHYPDLQTVKEKQRYGLFEVDFARRLLCKFRLTHHVSFWKLGLAPVPTKALFPEKNDPLVKLTELIRKRIARYL